MDFLSNIFPKNFFYLSHKFFKFEKFFPFYFLDDFFFFNARCKLNFPLIFMIVFYISNPFNAPNSTHLFNNLLILYMTCQIVFLQCQIISVRNCVIWRFRTTAIAQIFFIKKTPQTQYQIICLSNNHSHSNSGMS